jgi:hypothetical protein
VPLVVLIGLLALYLVGNVVLRMWLAPPWLNHGLDRRRLVLVLTAARYGPLLLYVVYMAAAGRSWWIFAVIFGAIALTAFWMLDGLLGYMEGIGVREEVRKLRDHQGSDRSE